jgi:hypothetical protein
MEWYDAYDKVKPYVFKIETPRKLGTGFLFAFALKKRDCGIATAAHVVREANEWEELIKVTHFQSGASRVLRPAGRYIFIDESSDTAAIMFPREGLALPDDPLPFKPEGALLKIGAEMGWVGFPALSPENLCFFDGRVSARLKERKDYLVDGVAINGVSGGPAFAKGGDALRIVGVVSAYVPNRATREILPGVSLVSNVEYLQGRIKFFKDIDKTKKKKAKVASTPPAPRDPAAIPEPTQQ